MSSKEVAHYVVTAHPPGAVLMTAKCNFLAPDSTDVIIAKSRRLEIRQLNSSSQDTTSPFSLVCQIPIFGRITAMLPLKVPTSSTSMLFLLTDRMRYAVISYKKNWSPYHTVTHASGSLKSAECGVLGKEAENAPLVAVDPYGRCIALHLYDGLLTILPINLAYNGNAAIQKGNSLRKSNLLGEAHHLRMEERTILDLVFLYSTREPQVAVLHQDSHFHQHVTTHGVNLKKKTLQEVETDRIKKARVDGGSAMIVAVPPPATRVAAASVNDSSTNGGGGGGVLVLGQRQITFLGVGITKVVPVAQAIILECRVIGQGRYLMGDEYGNLYLLAIQSSQGMVTGLTLDALGTTTVVSSIQYLADGLVFVGSQLGDSQLIQIHDSPPQQEEEDPLMPSSLISIVEEYTHLGPIVDFDLVPTGGDQESHQSQVVTASGVSFSGSIRLIRNGIGMNEYACVEIPGIQNMWSVRKNFEDKEHAYLVQSFVGETRVLGVSAFASDDMQDDNEEEGGGGTLEEVFLSGLDSTASSLFVGNVQVGNTLLQITESQIRLLDAATLQCVDTWSPSVEELLDNDSSSSRLITVASATESGQIVLALRGGMLLYFAIDEAQKIVLVHKKEMEREISCIDLNPFVATAPNDMDIDSDTATTPKSTIVAVGLWVDFTVRLLSLEDSLEQLLEINLSTEEDAEREEANAAVNRTNRNNMMARSLCLITLDSSSTSGASSSSTAAGVNMLFVGLGDGTLVSFAVVEQNDNITVRSKKEVSLGTQRIHLVPLKTERGGTCVLATGDRPTVIYLAGGGGSDAVNFSNPKLCYSNVNLSTSDADDPDDVSRPPAQQSIAVNVATPFTSSLLFDTASSSTHYSLCVSDDANLRLGVIDDIQKLHVTTCRLGMTPRRIVHCAEGRLFAVGCKDSGIRQGGAMESGVNVGNSVRFLDDTTFDDIHRVDLEPYEEILSMVSARLCTSEPSGCRSEGSAGSVAGGGNEAPSFPSTRPYLLVGTAYTLPDEDEPTRGRILVFSCSSDGIDGGKSAVRQVTELQVRGAVWSMCQFYDGKMLFSVASKTHICELTDDGTGVPKLNIIGIGHHGHTLSYAVNCRAHLATAEDASDAADMNPIPMLHDTPTKMSPKSEPEEKEQLAIVGDLMRSISLVQYYSKHETLEEIARDFNANWTTAIEMLTDDVYLGAENFNNLYVLRRNTKAQSEEVRCRLDTVGEFHLGEMVNKFMGGSLVMPHHSNASSGSARRGIALRPAPSPTKGSSEGKPKAASATSRTRRPIVNVGSQTLFGTVDGSLGSILGLDMRTAVFFAAVERAMERTIKPVGDFSHHEFRSFNAENRAHPSHGFVDGDLVESFLDLDRATMESVVREMNVDGGWEIEDHGAAAGGAREAGKDGVSGSGRGSSLSDEEDDDMSTNGGSVLTVENVLAMVEEMTMLH